MSCRTVDLPGGNGTVIVRRRGRKPASCSYCSRPSSRLCDFPVKGKRGGTCDVAMCERCSTRIAGERDLCRDHASLWNTPRQEAERCALPALCPAGHRVIASTGECDTMRETSPGTFEHVTGPCPGAPTKESE